MNQVMMKSMQQRVAGFLLALLAALAAASSTSAAAAASGTVIRMQLSHTDAGRGLTPGELLQRMALRSKSRAAARLRSSSSSSSSSASAPVTPGEGFPSTEYLVHFSIGTPPQRVQLVLDTGSDLVWTQCLPCTINASCSPQALPYFDPSASSTFQHLPCDSWACQDLGSQSQSSCANHTCVYTYSYEDDSRTDGQLAGDTFVFDQGQMSNLSFGCGRNNSLTSTSNETGVAGFGLGALSLPSQLKVDNFSYCFTNITGSTPSPVLLGLPANLYGSGGGAVQTTPLIQSPDPDSTLYYLNLTSIAVGSTTLRVPASAFALNAGDGTGGTYIDSGTAITSLPPHAFSLLRDAFASQLNMTPVAVTSQPDFLCFPASTQATTVPTLQLRFDGATLDLPQENYVFAVEDKNSGQNSTCIAILESPGGDDENTTTIGNYQQQNMHVLYDLAGNRLSLVPAQCDKV